MVNEYSFRRLDIFATTIVPNQNLEKYLVIRANVFHGKTLSASQTQPGKSVVRDIY